MSKIDNLLDALDHIMRVAQNSRTQTRRLRWIAERAKSAINEDDNWKDINLPKMAQRTEKEWRQSVKIKAMEAQLKTTQQPFFKKTIKE